MKKEIFLRNTELWERKKKRLKNLLGKKKRDQWKDKCLKTQFNSSNISYILLGKETCPNINIIFIIIQSIAVTNYADEGLFNCITINCIKNYLWNTIGEVKLNTLAIMVIESNLTEMLDF